MWSYYGAKTSIIDQYPKPKCDRIIEPFCGTARYALKYFEKEVLLVDKYEVITSIWLWLQKCSPKDVLSLPSFKAGENINSVTYDCDEARYLVGFLCGFGFTHPRKIATVRNRDRPNHMPAKIKEIAASLFKIRHWQIYCGTYSEIPNQKATWFIDPPYQFGGHAYIMSNKKLDFVHLGGWCKEREGHVIVCENTRATWMDFKPMVVHHVRTGRNHEAIWSNEPTAFDYQQRELFQNTSEHQGENPARSVAPDAQ